MSYQPRRAAEIEATPDVAKSDSSRLIEPRRASGLGLTSERSLQRGGVLLAAITVAATSAVVAVGSNGGSAAAVGAIPSASPSAEAEALVAAELTGSSTSQVASSTLTDLVGHTRLYVKNAAKVLADSDADAKTLGKLSQGARVSATGEVDGAYRQIEYGDGEGWVLAKLLSDVVVEEVPDGTTMSPCSRGSAVEKKLRKDTIFIYRSVCALFPAVNSFGGWRAGGMQFHKNGRALDIMLTPYAESALGKRIAKYLIKHADDFNVDHIIFEQKIWTPSNPTWRLMADRGGVTENHFNHVHVAIKA